MPDLTYENEMSNEDGFREYRRLILTELKRLGRDQEVFAARSQGQFEALRETFMLKLDSLQTQISDLRSEVKAGERERKTLGMVWGFLGGAVPIIVWILFQVMGN
jgi:hypothetical protein